MEKVINFKELIAPSLWCYVQDYINNRYTYYVNSGGRCSTKSSVVSLVTLLDMECNPLGHTVVFRKAQTQLRDSVVEQFKWAIETLGLSHIWQLKLAPRLKYVNRITKQEIRFLGCDNAANVTKGQKFYNGYCRNIIFEEADQFSGLDEIQVILASLLRNNGYKEAVHKVNIVYNPPQNVNAWINQPGIFNPSDTKTYHTTYKDVPNEWLSQQYKDLINYTKVTDYNRYQWEYLGKPIGNGNLVFTNIEERSISDHEIETMYSDKVYAGIDFGFKKDPTTWIKLFYNGNELVLLDEFYGKGVFMPQLADYIKARNCERIPTIADCASPGLIAELRNLGVNARPCVKGKNSIDIGVKKLQEIPKIVIDKNRTPNAWLEFVNYALVDKRDGKTTYINQDHYIDPVRYVILLYRN